MIRAIINGLSWIFGQGPEIELESLRRARYEAHREFIASRLAHDTRRQHEARRALKAATSALLRFELAHDAKRSRAKLSSRPFGSKPLAGNPARLSG